MRAKLLSDVQFFVGIVAATLLVMFVPYALAFASWPTLNPLWEGLYLVVVPFVSGMLTRRVLAVRQSRLRVLSDLLFAVGAILLGLLGANVLAALAPSPWLGWPSVVLPPLVLALGWALAFGLCARQIDATWTVRPYLVLLTATAIAVRAPLILAPGQLAMPPWLPCAVCGLIAGGCLVVWRVIPAVHGRVKLTRLELCALLGATASVLGWLFPR